VARLRNVIRRLARPPEEVRAENLRRWASSVEGATPIKELKARNACCVAGVIQNIRIDPRVGSGSIEATIIDGTGQMVAKWLGRSTLSGITLGMGLIIEGIIGVASDGELTVINPEYRLVPGPEH
jgi:OB-fold nucleic acid binding protein